MSEQEAEHRQVTDEHGGDIHKILKASINKHGDGDLSEHLQKMFNFLILHYPGQAL
jgi:hypothetical protein